MKAKMHLKKYIELWKKIEDLIGSINNSLEYYHKKYRKIKVNSEDDLTLTKTIELNNIIKVVR